MLDQLPPPDNGGFLLYETLPKSVVVPLIEYVQLLLFVLDSFDYFIFSVFRPIRKYFTVP